MKKILFLSLLFTSLAAAQEAKLYSFIHYTTSSGLISNQVYTIVQDADGYMWIGGTDGLQRFDGTRYKTFHHTGTNQSSLPANGVLQLLFDKQKRLWISFADGSVGIFNTHNFNFEEIEIRPVNKSSLETAYKRLIMDEQGNIFYLLVGRELLLFNEYRREFSKEKMFFTPRPEWKISDLAQQPGTQKYWVGVEGLGTAIYNRATGQLSYPGNNIEKEPGIDAYDKSIHPVQMLFDKKGRVWYFCWVSVFPEIFCFDTRTNTAERFQLLTTLKKYHEINGFIEQNDGSIWVYGLKVFAKFLEKEKKFQQVYNGYTNENGIAYELIPSMFEDREGSIWTGSNNNGIFRFNPAREYFNTIVHVNRQSGVIGNGNPMSFIRTKWGTLLNGTWEDGLYFYDSSFNSMQPDIKGLEKNPFIWSMFTSHDSNTIWMSSQPGIFSIDQATRKATFYDPPILEHKTVSRIAEDKRGDLWLGMFRTGVFKWHRNKNNKLSNDDLIRFAGIPSNQGINQITVDKTGLIWIGTNSDGCYVIDPGTEKILMHFAKDAKDGLTLPDGTVSAVLEYNDSLMILTTANRIVAYNRYTKQSALVGLPDAISGAITAMVKDNNGFLWISSSSGLYRVNISRRVVVRFNREDGIQYDNFVPGAGYQLPDGRLLFGTSNQFVFFDPVKMMLGSKVPPNVTITDFEVMNKMVSVDSLMRLKEINLNYDQNSIHISFSTLVYTTPYRIQYQMQGLDKDWKLADNDQDATYTFLPKGSYQLLFRTFDEEGNFTESKQHLTIIVNPPFWQTWWFYSLLTLMAGLVLFLLDRSRMNRKEAVQKMRSNIADNLHEDVNTALNNINILSEMARLKADREPEKSKEFIEQIHSKSHNMIIAMDDMLWSIAPENDNMEKTVERMQEYIDALNHRHNCKVEMMVDKKVRMLKLDMHFRYEAFLLFKETVKSLEQVKAQNSKIYLTLENNGLLYTIQFNYENSDSQQINVLLQRQDMNRRMAVVQGKLDIQINKSNAVVELRIPLK